jgi:hypothetical protein
MAKTANDVGWFACRRAASKLTSALPYALTQRCSNSLLTRNFEPLILTVDFVKAKKEARHRRVPGPVMRDGVMDNATDKHASHLLSGAKHLQRSR